MGDQYKGFKMSVFKRYVVVIRDFHLDRLVWYGNSDDGSQKRHLSNRIFCRKRARPQRLENKPMYIAKQRT